MHPTDRTISISTAATRESVTTAVPAQLELRRTSRSELDTNDTDLPLPKTHRIEARGVWMLGADDDRLSRRGTRDDLWSLQRSQRRPQPQSTL